MGFGCLVGINAFFTTASPTRVTWVKVYESRVGTRSTWWGGSGGWLERGGGEGGSGEKVGEVWGRDREWRGGVGSGEGRLERDGRGSRE